MIRSVLCYISENILISILVGITLYFRKYSNICSGWYFVIFQEIFLYLFRLVLCDISGNTLIYLKVSTVLYVIKYSNIDPVGILLYLKKHSNMCSGQYYLIQEIFYYLFILTLCYLLLLFLLLLLLFCFQEILMLFCIHRR